MKAQRSIYSTKYNKARISESVVEEMYKEYLQLQSVEKVGKKRGVSRQSVYELFKTRGLPLTPKVYLPFVEYRGLKFTNHKGYLRGTIDRSNSVYLHQLIWEEVHGPIPPGYKVCFIDGNPSNCQISNLELLSNSDQVRKHATGANQFTKTAAAKLQLLLRKAESGETSIAASIKGNS